ncbi:MAG: M20/M25/M40 family metallo-hydrolase [Kofleriaceae bacterium]
MSAVDGARAAQLLIELIRLRTQQPGADGTAGDERGFCDALVPRLLPHAPDELAIVDAPRGGGGPGAYLYARWGTPTRVINAHVDTVPANDGWTRDPWAGTLKGDRVYGLGACDTKGAIAAAIIALGRGRPRDAALLFSGDEEHGTASVAHFLASPRARGLRAAIVCEPTARVAGVAHRGVLAYRARLRGTGGHSSKADHEPRPIATLARLAVALDDLGRARLTDGAPGMLGLCMNVARLAGGVAFNVIPAEATLHFSVRPWPGFDRAGWDAELGALVRGVDPAIELTCDVDHAPFGCLDEAAVRPLVAAAARRITHLDFWTEAALYDAAGIAAVVIGPGDIAQAHAPDEFVTVDDLAWAVDLYASVLAGPA